MKYNVQPFYAQHEDIIHDLTYNYYGDRLATCSSDQKIKVWDKRPLPTDGAAATTSMAINKDSRIMAPSEEQEWELNDEWKAHDASVVKVDWAHPEFGHVLASCSFDRSVRIWEEQEHEPLRGGRRWTERARLVDSRGSVMDIAFAPHHMGLKLATASTDGIVRIYEAMDIVNLALWTLMEEFEVCPAGKEIDGQVCLSWCQSRFQPPMLAVGCGNEHIVKIYQYDDQHRKWVVVESLNGHGGIVRGVSWAPNMGRSYGLIATACQDQRLRIYKLSQDLAQIDTDPSESALNGSMIESELIAEFADHNDEVWRVDWNITGTVLSSSGDDGKIRLWRANFDGTWKCILVVSTQPKQ